MDRNGERIHLTIASITIAAIMITVTKESTVNYLAYYMGYEYFAALVIFNALVVIEIGIIIAVVTRRNDAWRALICARACAVCATLSGTYDLFASTPQTLWAALIEWIVCLAMISGTQNAVLKLEKSRRIR